MDSTGSKRRFSRIDLPPSQNAGEEATDKLEGSDSIEKERREAIEALSGSASSPCVDQSWWDTFINPARTSTMGPLRLGSGPSISSAAFLRLKDWYGLDEDVVIIKCSGANGSNERVLNSSPEKVLTEVIKLSPGDILYVDGRRVDDPSTEKVRGVVSLRIEPAGLKGLSNLGNTCYMNSALQCLTHVEELVAYFLSGHYEQDVNTSNPIGYGGNVARAFARLLRALYGHEDTRSVSPVQFKATIGRYNRAFAGYLQQDSQEFFSWLLDSLHEDLNRVVEKPPTTKPELPEDSQVTPREVSELAERCWKTHCLRNDSVIQDLFTGLYKSTIVCPICGKVSITFDPFLNLTLPLPSSNVWMHKVTVLPLSGGISSLEVVLEPLDNIGKLKMQIQQLTGISGNLKLMDIWQHKIYNEFSDSALLAESVDVNDYLVAYEVPEDPVCVFTRVNHVYQGLPFFISSRSLSSTEIMHYPVLSQLKKYADTGQVSALYVQSAETKQLRLLDSPPSPSEVERRENNEPSPLDLSQSIECLTPPPPSDVRMTEPGLIVPREDDDLAASASSTSSPISALSSSPSISNQAKGQPQNELCGKLSTGDGLVIDVSSLKMYEPHAVANPIADAARSKHREGTSLDACLATFSQPEILGEHDLWYCSRCHDFRRARKQMELWRSPDVIMVHLKRFSEGISRKVTDVVTFPLTDWNVGRHVSNNHVPEDLVYDLFAVDNHYGGMGGGHYTSYVLNSTDNQWYLYDDSRVTAVADLADLVSGTAYLLFYRRRHTGSLGKISESFGDALKASRAPSQPEQITSNQGEKELVATPQADRFPGEGRKLGSGTYTVSKAPWASPHEHPVPASEVSEQSAGSAFSPTSSKSSVSP